MAHCNKPNNDAEMRDLFIAKLNAVSRGDIDALHAINNKIFFARLDPSDPEYADKLARHEKHEREWRAEQKAKKVIEETDRPFCFEDSLNAIDDVIESAVETFERYPCPQHAADLLGLIECRTLLFAEHLETGIAPDEEEDGD